MGTDGKMIKSVVAGVSKAFPDIPLLLLSQEGGKGVCLAQVTSTRPVYDTLVRERTHSLGRLLSQEGGKGGCLAQVTSLSMFIPQKVFIRSFCKSQFSHKYVH